MSGNRKLNGTVIVTYRCNARCSMCNRYKAPSKPEEELSIETIKKLPPMYFTNITGGEPFIRTDLPDIVRELYKKSDRIVISTNGFFTDRIIALAKEFPKIGIRISIEGLEKTNNEIRGLENGFQRGYRTLLKLKKMGLEDIGFGMTVQDRNAPDLVPLYNISDKLGMEFATASLHNSFYFVESRNIIHDRPMVAANFEKLINRLLKSKSPKKWFRAYFNHGLINYIYGQPRLLPCDMSFDTFFIDPYGNVMPCNGTKDREIMGNLNEQSWKELWNSPQAEEVRKKVRHCDRQCWMIGSVSPAMHRYIWKPAWWVFTHKLRSFFTDKPYSMYENPICRKLRDGKVTKAELDACSTCDMNADACNGLGRAAGKPALGKLRGRRKKAVVSGYVGKKITGIGRNLINLLNNADSGMEYIVYTNEDMKEDMQFTNPNVTVKTYPVSKNSSMGNLLWNTFVFPLMVKKERADIALIPNFTLLLFKAAPTAIIMHDLIEFNIPEKFSKLRMFYRTKIADPITARRADSVITVSQNSKNDIIKFLGIGADKISVIFNGADRERFRRMDACRAREILTARGLPTEFILYTGTVDHPGKNSMTLIKAFESLKRSGRYDGSLIIAGMPGSGYDIVKDYADRSPYASDICFAGFVTDEELVALYSLCSAFVLVSLYEGFGIPPLEAISCGARVVVSNTSSLPEVVGELGLTVPPTDTEAVADAIYECTQHSADEDYLRAVDAHMKKFDWKDLSRQLESQLFRTMRKKGKRNG